MATISAQNIVPAGLDPVYSAVTVADEFVDDGSQRTFLHVKNGAGAPINVTIEAMTTSKNVPHVGSVTIADQVVAVPAADERVIGPFSDAFRGPGGVVSVTYSSATSVTAAAVKLGRAA